MAVNGVEITGLGFSYGRGGHRLTDVSLSVRETDVCTLLGPNGAGKTTLLRCVLGLLTPEHGTIRVAGINTAELSARELARLVAYVPQTTSITFPFTTLDIAVMGRTPHLSLTATPSGADRRAALATLAELGIDHLAHRSFAGLSGGERQLTLIARALVQQAPVLILDEPTAALDYGNEVHLLRVVAELAAAGRAVLMTTHQPDHALAYATRAILMRNGAIIADGSPEDVVTSDSLTELYGTPIHVARVALPGRGARSARTCIPVQLFGDGSEPIRNEGPPWASPM
ncbi:MAG: ABC transporter ATP-binding protein [Pseudonocardiaceae bacterium]|jgi:iron complex transport system ATP-binding protein